MKKWTRWCYHISHQNGRSPYWKASIWKRKTHKYLVSIWTSCSPNDSYHIKPSGVGWLRWSVLPFSTLLSDTRSVKTVSGTLRGAGESRCRTVLPCPTSQLLLTYSNVWITETCAALPCVGCFANLCPEHCVAQAKADSELCCPFLPLNSCWHIQTCESQKSVLLCPAWAALPASQCAPYITVVIQHATRVRRIILSSVSSLVVP
jgi:hypothetical protein